MIVIWNFDSQGSIYYFACLWQRMCFAFKLLKSYWGTVGREEKGMSAFLPRSLCWARVNEFESTRSLSSCCGCTCVLKIVLFCCVLRILFLRGNRTFLLLWNRTREIPRIIYLQATFPACSLVKFYYSWILHYIYYNFFLFSCFFYNILEILHLFNFSYTYTIKKVLYSD